MCNACDVLWSAAAQVVLVPYNVLLHAPTRASFGLDLRGCVVVVDEAHNFLETLASIHSVQLSLVHVRLLLLLRSLSIDSFY